MALVPFLSDSPSLFLSLSSCPWPVFSPWGGVGEWIDGLVGGQEKGKRKEGYNGSKHSYIDLFFRLQKYNFF